MASQIWNFQYSPTQILIFQTLDFQYLPTQILNFQARKFQFLAWMNFYILNFQCLAVKFSTFSIFANANLQFPNLKFSIFAKGNQAWIFKLYRYVFISLAVFLSNCKHQNIHFEEKHQWFSDTSTLLFNVVNCAYFTSLDDVNNNVYQGKQVEDHQQCNRQNKREKKGPRLWYETFVCSLPCYLKKRKQ